MANGRPGDHPFTDIVMHDLEVISPEVTRLVKAIASNGDESVNEIARDLVWYMRPELANESWRPLILKDLERDLLHLRNIGEKLNQAS